ncbi:MAG: GFA family protein [Pseudomonadota bacterium]
MIGQCLCGSVRYECDDPTELMLCHCKDCQRATGSAYAPIAMVPEATFRLTGETKSYAVKGTNGMAVNRHFCPTCGGQMFSTIDEVPGLIIVKTGTADNLPDIPVSAVFWTDSAPHFADVPAGAAAFPGNPPS